MLHKFCNTTGMFENLGGWSNSYVNLELGPDTVVELELEQLWGTGKVERAVVRPAAAARDCSVQDGKAVLTITKPGLFTVDINGQMEDQDTGKGYR